MTLPRLLALPLVSGANLRALIFIHQKESSRFRLTEIELARTLTNQASIALENARLFQSTLFTAERFSFFIYRQREGEGAPITWDAATFHPDATLMHFHNLFND